MSKVKGVQVSATISPELNTALEDHRWTVRKTKAEVIKAAIEEYAEHHQLLTTPASEPAPENVV
jgi:predicted DNA-binding protein